MSFYHINGDFTQDVMPNLTVFDVLQTIYLSIGGRLVHRFREKDRDGHL